MPFEIVFSVRSYISCPQVFGKYILWVCIISWLPIKYIIGINSTKKA